MPTISLNNIDLYYEESGAGEPLLLLHGLGSSVQDWELQLPAWNAHYRVIRVDMRGHGRSAKPAGPYSVKMMSGDVIDFVQKLAISPVHIVGISMGGMIGLQLALDAPELLKSLVVINSVAELKPRTLSEKMKTWQRLLIVRLIGMRKMGEVLAKRMFPEPDQLDIHLQFIERWATNDRKAYLESLKALLGWSVLARLSEIQCPVLFLASEFDSFPLTAKETAVSRIPNATLQLIPNSRHAATADQPDLVNTAVLDFLKTQ